MMRQGRQDGIGALEQGNIPCIMALHQCDGRLEQVEARTCDAVVVSHWSVA